MIPKIIHYCWFGESNIPELQLKYIEEWRNLHLDWEFMLWNEDNAPMHLPYLQKAQALGNWANMSNYVRFYALLKWGGIYLDTDIKLIKKLDFLLENECFFGFEDFDKDRNEFWVNNAIFGAIKNQNFIKVCHDELLKKYDGEEEANLSAPKLVTELLIQSKGLCEYKEQILDGIKLYPIEYFYPIHYTKAYKLSDIENNIFPETIAVHVWARTWIAKEKLMETIDLLNQTVDSKEEYISDLVNTIDVLNKKADEIYYWKQHFEKEYNRLIKENDFVQDNIAWDKLSSVFNKLEEHIADLKSFASEKVESNNKTLEEQFQLLEKINTRVVDFHEKVSKEVGTTTIALNKVTQSVNKAQQEGLEHSLIVQNQLQRVFLNIDGISSSIDHVDKLIAENSDEIKEIRSNTQCLISSFKNLSNAQNIILKQQDLITKLSQQINDSCSLLDERKDIIRNIEMAFIKEKKNAEITIEQKNKIIEIQQQEMLNYKQQMKGINIGSIVKKTFFGKGKK